MDVRTIIMIIYIYIYIYIQYTCGSLEAHLLGTKTGTCVFHISEGTDPTIGSQQVHL